MNSRVYVEEWQAHYGTPLQIDLDLEALAAAELVEESASFAITPDESAPPERLAFVDGVRRGDAYLYLEDPKTGALAHGVAGAHARGAALYEQEEVRCEHLDTTWLVIWGSGFIADLPEVRGGYRWQSRSVADTDHDAPLRELQRRMRLAEGQLAETLAKEGWTVVCDGPLNFVRSTDLPVCGFVKTHHRPLLVPMDQRQGGDARPAVSAARCSRISDRYSCYLRLVERGPSHGPWHGIARLEFPQSAGFDEASESPTPWRSRCRASPASAISIPARRRTCSPSGPSRSSFAAVSAIPARPDGRARAARQLRSRVNNARPGEAS